MDGPVVEATNGCQHKSVLPLADGRYFCVTCPKVFSPEEMMAEFGIRKAVTSDIFPPGEDEVDPRCFTLSTNKGGK